MTLTSSFLNLPNSRCILSEFRNKNKVHRNTGTQDSCLFQRTCRFTSFEKEFYFYGDLLCVKAIICQIGRNMLVLTLQDRKSARHICAQSCIFFFLLFPISNHKSTEHISRMQCNSGIKEIIMCYLRNNKP